MFCQTWCANRQQGTIDALGNENYFELDASGNQIKQVDARSNVTYFYYDILNRQQGTIDALGNENYFVFDALGNQSAIVDPLFLVNYFQYDPLNRLEATQDPINALNYFAYDQIGNLSSITDALFNTTYYSHDVLNRLESIENALDQVDQYTYDPVGNLMTSSDPDENTIYFEHDQLNRQTRIDYPDGNFSYYQYNAVSDLTLMEDPHGISYFEYNDLSRLSSEKQPGGATTTYNYNGLGQTILMNNSVGQIKYTYDAAKRMTQIDNVSGFYGYGSQPWANTPYGGDVDGITDSCYYEYNANNLMTKKTLGNGVFTYFSYDEANRVTQILNCSPDGSPLVYFSYDYDQSSRITSIERENGTVIYYGYDDASRLTSEIWYDSGMSLIRDYEWGYDLVGNRTHQVHDFERIDYLYDESNALTFWGVEGANFAYFTYDSRGNCTQIEKGFGGTTYFEYNHANLVTRITYKDGTENYFHYDGMLRRYAMEDSDGLRYFTWDRNGLNLLVERDEAGEVLAEYKHGYVSVMGIGSMVYGKKTVSEATYYQYPVFDHRGTVYKVTDENGDVIGDYEYNAWGQPLLDDDPLEGNRYHYQSDWLNLKDSGGELLISPARIYHAGVGRFLSHDPLAIVNMRDKLGVYQNSKLLSKRNKRNIIQNVIPNVYLYLNKNVLLATDPIGLYPVTVTHNNAQDLTREDIEFDGSFTHWGNTNFTLSGTYCCCFGYFRRLNGEKIKSGGGTLLSVGIAITTHVLSYIEYKAILEDDDIFPPPSYSFIVNHEKQHARNIEKMFRGSIDKLFRGVYRLYSSKDNCLKEIETLLTNEFSIIKGNNFAGLFDQEGKHKTPNIFGMESFPEKFSTPNFRGNSNIEFQDDKIGCAILGPNFSGKLFTGRGG